MPAMPPPTLSLIIPCYNEAGNLPRLVARCVEVFAGSGHEVVLVDNGSTDDTARLLPGLIEPYPFLRTTRVEVNQGYGFGILSGLRAATGEYLGWTHADLQTDPADALKGLELILSSPDPVRVFAKGSRYGRPLRDRLFAWGMAAFEFLILGKRLWDIHAQPALFHHSVYRAWAEPPHDFSLDLFAYWRAVADGMTIRRFPVYFGPRLSGTGHNETLAAKLRYSRRTILYSFALRRRLLKETSC
jgi:glycosyltransferase involved in cell wall biosynthesis